VVGSVKIPVDRLPEGSHVEQWYTLKDGGQEGASLQAAVKLRLRLVVRADPSVYATASPMADAAFAAAALAAMAAVASPDFNNLPPPPPPEPSRSPSSLQPGGLPSAKFAGGLLRKQVVDTLAHAQTSGSGRSSPTPATLELGCRDGGLPAFGSSRPGPGVLSPKASSVHERRAQGLVLPAEPVAHVPSPISRGFGEPPPPPDAVRADAGWWRRQVIASGLVDFVAVRVPLPHLLPSCLKTLL
jgi:hypothetical protein